MVFGYDMIGYGQLRDFGWSHRDPLALKLQLWNSIRGIDFLISMGADGSLNEKGIVIEATHVLYPLDKNILFRRMELKQMLMSVGNRPQNLDIDKKLRHAINVIRSMDEILSTTRVELKILLIGSMFPEKILFDGENYRTNSYNKVLEWIFQNTNVLQDKKKKKQMKILFLPFLYPEPESNRHGHYWPLDFKSSASTYSAIRASCRLLLLLSLYSPSSTFAYPL